MGDFLFTDPGKRAPETTSETRSETTRAFNPTLMTQNMNRGYCPTLSLGTVCSAYIWRSRWLSGHATIVARPHGPDGAGRTPCKAGQVPMAGILTHG